VCAAENILRDVNGEPMQPFDYHDKGIMAMIGHNAAVAEMGKRRHELHGSAGYAAWLGVHAYLMSGTRQRRDAFIDWAWDEFGKSRVLDTSDEARLRQEGDEDA
jgi:NADH dehydrogenase